jgi:arylsulfatase A
MKQSFPLGLLSLSVLLSGSCKQQEEQQKPNVIFILADDLGYNDVSCYRNAHPQHSDQPPTSQTSSIDELAEEGMRFTDFYAGAPVSSPSRAALITGRNATRVGVYNWIPGNSPMHLRSEEVTIAEMLKDKNYLTGHFGKWHLTSRGTDQPLPNDQGFDYSFYTYNNANPSHRNPENFYRNGKALGELKGYACNLVVDEAIQWLKDNQNSERPFYLNVWFNEPHTRLAAPDSLKAHHSYFPKYYGAIENMDNAVGRLMNYLEEKAMEEETIVFFSSDNGSKWPHSNDPLYGEKCFTFEGGVREPFIIRWPGKVPAGAVSRIPGSFTDILPSIAELTGAKLPEKKKLDGVSLAQVFTGKSKKLERKHPIFFYRYFHDPICMLRKGDYVLLGYDSLITKKENLNEGELDKIKPWGFRKNHMEYLDTLKPKHFELYNIRLDKGQENDISGSHPEKLKQMKKQMLNLRNEMVEEGGDWFEDE